MRYLHAVKSNGEIRSEISTMLVHDSMFGLPIKSLKMCHFTTQLRWIFVSKYGAATLLRFIKLVALMYEIEINFVVFSLSIYIINRQPKITLAYLAA